MKTAVIYNGYSFNYNFYENKNGKYKNRFDKRIYILDLPDTDLMEFDLVIVPGRTNQQLLYKNSEKFIDYLEAGKWLVSCGEMPEQWLPNVKWTYTPTNFTWWLSEDEDLPLIPPNPEHPLFKHTELENAKWHYHGFFTPPEGATAIINNENGGAILYEDNVSFKGKAIITSLDPMYHFGQGFMPKTEPFLDGFLAWIEEKFENEMVGGRK